MNNILVPFFEQLTKEEKVTHNFSRTLHQHTMQKIQCMNCGLFPMNK